MTQSIVTERCVHNKVTVTTTVVRQKAISLLRTWFAPAGADEACQDYDTLSGAASVAADTRR